MAGVLREQFIGQSGVLDEQAPSPAVVATLTGVQAGAQSGSITASGAAMVILAGIAAAAGVTPPTTTGAALASLMGLQAVPAVGSVLATSAAPAVSISVRFNILPRNFGLKAVHYSN